MKKVTRIFAIICIIVMMMPMMVQAVEVRKDSIDDIAKAQYGVIDELSDECKEAAKWYQEQNLKLVWAIYSLQNHQWLETRYYERNNQNGEMAISRLDDPNVDFIQFGTLMSSLDARETEDELQRDSVTAALNVIMPLGQETESFKQKILSNNMPVWWKIEKLDENSFKFEIAVGKYEIKWGDTLSEIAEEYQTTVERLVELNSNITDPNLIYAGDYLVIK